MMSSSNPSPTSLFGIELADVWASLTRPWRNLHRSAGLAWLAPPVQVRLIQADGRESAWEGDRQLAGAPEAGDFVAVEVPEDMYLRRSLSLPPMEAADLENAVALDVQAASPFGTQDLVWGYAARPVAGQQAVDVVFASRRQIGEHLDKVRSRLPAGTLPEVWARAESGAPIIMRGYGEQRRASHVAARWKVGVVLLLLAAALATAVAVTPTAQLRLRAIQAGQAYEEASRRAEPLIRKREQLVQAGADLAIVNSLMAQRVDAAYALDYLTRIIPDDTFLTSLNVQGNKATLLGQTSNAAALMQRLSAEPGLRDVRAPSPAVRAFGSSKETFNVEFTFDARPAASGAAPAAAAVPAPAVAAPVAAPEGPTAATAPATPAQAPAPAAAAPAPAAPAAPAASPAAPSSPGGFTIGGTGRSSAPAGSPASAARAAP